MRAESEVLTRELFDAPLHVLFGALDAIKRETDARFLRHQGGCNYLVSQSVEIFEVCKTRNHWIQHCLLEDKEGHVLSEGQLIDAMRRFKKLGHFVANKTLAVESPEGWQTPFEGWTSTWHIAAEKGMLDVLKFLVYECACQQPLHTRTKEGNNAYAHAARAMDRIMADPNLSNAHKAREAVKYNRVLTFLRSIGLDVRPWRDPETMSVSELEVVDDVQSPLFDDPDDDPFGEA